MLESLAKKAGIQAYLVLYDIDKEAPHGLNDLLRVQRIAPEKSAICAMKIDEFGKYIEAIHQAHKCYKEMTDDAKIC